MAADCNLKIPSIPLVIGSVTTAWERIPDQMVRKSLLQCGTVVLGYNTVVGVHNLTTVL